MLNAFRAFVSDKNAMDMAVALFTGVVDFSGWFYAMDVETNTSLAAATEAGAPVFAFGNCIIIAIVGFMLVKTVNWIKDAARG